MEIQRGDVWWIWRMNQNLLAVPFQWFLPGYQRNMQFCVIPREDYVCSVD